MLDRFCFFLFWVGHICWVFMLPDDWTEWLPHALLYILAIFVGWEHIQSALLTVFINSVPQLGTQIITLHHRSLQLMKCPVFCAQCPPTTPAPNSALLNSAALAISVFFPSWILNFFSVSLIQYLLAWERERDLLSVGSILKGSRPRLGTLTGSC